MKNTTLASRYAKALYTLAHEHSQQDVIFEQMRVIGEVLAVGDEVARFFLSPLVRPSEKVEALSKLTAKMAAPDALKNFLLVLAKKNRLGIFSEILAAYQNLIDEAHGVTRGHVRSATLLAPEERKQIETLVGRATKKQVILTYKEDPGLLGGLVADVGSFTFDDSLISHLKRINEQLTRSGN